MSNLCGFDLEAIYQADRSEVDRVRRILWENHRTLVKLPGKDWAVLGAKEGIPTAVLERSSDGQWFSEDPCVQKMIEVPIGA